EEAWMREVDTRYIRSSTWWTYSSGPSLEVRQKGQPYAGDSLDRATRARMFTPIRLLGGTPMNSAKLRFTRKTFWLSSCTTMKSVIASKISIQWRLALP